MVKLIWSGYKKLTNENVDNLPTFEGVYKLATYNTQTEKYKPFYVGQAEDIRERTQQHNGDSESNNCIKDKFKKYWVYINYVAVSSESNRDSVEVALYNHYLPDCNDPGALPDVKPADISPFN